MYEIESRDDCILPCTSDKSPFSYRRKSKFIQLVTTNKQPQQPFLSASLSVPDPP